MPCGFVLCEAIKKAELAVPAFGIDIYIQQEERPLVLSSRRKSGWHSPPKSYCAFLALHVVRTFLFAGLQMDNADKNER